MKQTIDNKRAKQLFADYFALVCKIVRKYPIPERDFDDMVQEGLLALFDAAESYRPESGLPFSAYASVCIGRRVRRAVSSFHARKHSPLNESVPLEEQAIVGKVAQSPEQIVLGRENIRHVNRKIRLLLSPLERKILALRLQGMSYKRIAGQLGVPTKTVDNALLRVRQKLKPHAD